MYDWMDTFASMHWYKVRTIRVRARLKVRTNPNEVNLFCLRPLICLPSFDLNGLTGSNSARSIDRIDALKYVICCELSILNVVALNIFIEGIETLHRIEWRQKWLVSIFGWER